MCGRYAITLPAEAVGRLFGASGPPPDFAPRYNAAPGQMLPIVRRRPRDKGRELALARWGLVPSWSTGPDSRFSMINARAETVAARPAYRGAFLRRRCLVPASGFYEWRQTAHGKQPWLFTPAAGKAFALAGLWERWSGAGGEAITSFTILVTDANADVAAVHDRMPVILARAHHALWLGEAGAAAERDLHALLAPAPAGALRLWPVDRRVNSPENDDAGVMAPLAETGDGLLP